MKEGRSRFRESFKNGANGVFGTPKWAGLSLGPGDDTVTPPPPKV